MRRFVVWLLLVSLLGSCATYKPTVTPFRTPAAYANMQRLQGLEIAANTWATEEAARAAFGFNIIRAGLLPVQIIYDNKGSQTFEINPSQTFLENDRGELFQILDEQSAYDRVSRAQDLPAAARGVGKGALLGGAAGALIGAAIGVAVGHRVGDYAMRGAATGGAAGVLWGASAGDDDTARQITADLAQHRLRNVPLKPNELGRGIIFFPAEAGRPARLRLQLRDQTSQQTYNLYLPLIN